MIFARFDALAAGESFVLVNSHDPIHLREEFARDRPGAYDWRYLEGSQSEQIVADPDRPYHRCRPGPACCEADASVEAAGGNTVMTLSTEWSRAMGLEAPIVNAPMGGVAGGALAAAVSRAGGLGMVGIGSAGSAVLLDEQLGHLRELGRPFGIGLVDWVIASEPATAHSGDRRQAGVAVRQFR